MISSNNLPDELIAFLKSKGLLAEFLEETRTAKPSSVNYPKKLDDWVTLAFSWGSAKRDFNFWSDIDREWQNYLTRPAFTADARL